MALEFNMSTTEPEQLASGRRRLAAVVSVGVALALFLVAVAMRHPAHMPKGLEGQVAPRLELPVVTLRARAAPILYEVPGQHPRTVLLHFWGPSCAPCLAEFDAIEQLYAQATEGRQDVEVVTVSGETTADLRAFLTKREQVVPVLQDASGRVHDAYRITAIPTTFVIDPSGVIQRHLRGPQSYEGLREALEAVALASNATLSEAVHQPGVELTKVLPGALAERARIFGLDTPVADGEAIIQS